MIKDAALGSGTAKLAKSTVAVLLPAVAVIGS